MVVNGKRIEELMAVRGWTQADLAMRSGISISTLCNAMQGYAIFTRTAHKIARGLGVDVEEIFERPTAERVRVVLDRGAKMPTRAHSADAGLDIYSPVDAVIYPGESATIDTKVRIAIPRGYVGFLKSKSGLNVKYSVTSEGVIDSGYTGTIAVKLYNHGNVIFKVEQGMKISQLVLLPIITPELVLVDSLDQTDRGEGGFGSTGRF